LSCCIQRRAWRAVGDRVPCCAPCLRFDRCAMVPETRLLSTVLHTHPPATSTNCPVASDRGGGTVIPRPVLRPLPWPFCDVSGVQPPAMSIDQWGPRIGWEQHRVPAGDRPPLVPPLAIQLRSRRKKVHTWAKSRVSTEARELRLLTWECNFPEINIPSHIINRTFQLHNTDDTYFDSM